MNFHTVFFKNCRFGISSGNFFRRLNIDGTQILAVPLDSADAGLQRLLSPEGAIRGLPEKVFSLPGTLRLVPGEKEETPLVFPGVRLAGNTFYRSSPDKGKQLWAEFLLPPEEVFNISSHSDAV